MSLTFAELCQRYLERCWRADPIQTTRSGMRGYDHLWPELSPEALAADQQTVAELLAACAAQDRSALSADELLDLRCMECDLENAQLEFRLAQWQSDPYFYAGSVASGLSLLLSGDFAPAVDRLPAVLARLEGVERFLAEGQRQLNPARVPQLWVSIAQTGVAGALTMLEQSLPAFLAELTSGQAEPVQAAAERAKGALQGFDKYLTDLAPEAQGHYAVGEELFTALLQKRHLLDLSAEELYQWGLSMVEQYQAELEAAARAIDPERSWSEIMDEIREQYPPAEKWLEAFMEHMATSKQHIIEHDLVSIPDGESCKMIWTPPHMWATYPLGGMDLSAPYTDDLESRFFVTPNDESAPTEIQLQHHRDLNHTFLRSIALHEVYPGHHLQGVHAKQGQSMVRRWQHATTLVEGWGLYTETLMYETGYLDEPKVQLMYAKNSLWRAVRVVVDVGLHALGMSFEDAVKMLQEKLRMEYHMAAGEVRRYTMSPTYQSSYLLGRTAILELREEYKAKLGDQYTYKRFHDKLLSYGSAPMRLIREAMLAE